jgi:hypothetical protein
MVAAATASASKPHVFKEIFGSAAQPSFNHAQGMAVDQSSGDLLVMDNAGGGVDSIARFNPDGTPANFSALGTNVIDGSGSGDATPQNSLDFAQPTESQIAVDNSGTATDGNIYVTQGSPRVINIFADTGEYLGQLSKAGSEPFTESCGVAVDPSGSVYVGDYSGGIHKFVPSANPPVNNDNTANFSSMTFPCTLAAGAGPSEGILFAAEYAGPTSKLDSSTGEVQYAVSTDPAVTLSMDPATGHVYVGTGSEIKEYDALGASSANKANTLLASGAQGLALDGPSGDLYASRSGLGKVEVFELGAAIPDATTAPPSNIESTSATLHGAVNPDGVELTECFFEYGPTTSYGLTAPCAESPAAIGSGTGDVAVHTVLASLSVGTPYHFRLVARNANGESHGGGEAFLTQGPVLSAEAVQSAASMEATLQAAVNPNGLPTTYHIEYGPSAAYGSRSSERTVGSDTADHLVTTTLKGLQPASTYHWRVVATNSAGIAQGQDRTFNTYSIDVPGSSACPNQAFRTGLAAALPDCRAYEMVSPVDKNNGDIKTVCNGECDRTSLNQSAVDGTKFTFSSYKAFGDSLSAAYSNQYVATRGQSGWWTHGINPLRSNLRTKSFEGDKSATYDLDVQFKAFSDDLSTAWLTNDNQAPLSPDGTEGIVNIYRRDNTDDSYHSLTINEPILESYAQQQSIRLEGLSSDGSHAIFSTVAALTPDAALTLERQLYEFTDGDIRLVSVFPDGSVAANGANAGSGTDGINPSADHGFMTLDHAVSDDGSRIFWQPGGPFAGEAPLYVRIDGQQTVEVTSDPVEFRTASTDGSKVLYETGVGDYHDLFDFNVDKEVERSIAGEVRGVLGASDDASYIYFVSREDLATGAAGGENNLYLEHGGTTKFIATLAPQDIGLEQENQLQYPNVASDQPRRRSSRVTPDGKHIAFVSTRSLTGYDNTDAVSGKADLEIFLYDADTQALICASCNPSGARPAGQTLPFPYAATDDFQSSTWAAAWLNTAENSLYTPRAFSEDGKRLFFNSFDALVPRDSNGQQDVYEWEAQGKGSCKKAAGCVDLISSGQSPQSSEFIDAEPGGNSVFFETKSSLVPQDPGLIDVYVARVNGGFAPPPAPPAPCIGDACQSVPSAPDDPAAASASFKGPGNAVRKRKKKTHRKKTHAKRKQHHANHNRRTAR